MNILRYYDEQRQNIEDISTLNAKTIVYISCKPTSLARDLETLIGCGYVPVKICGVDQFPQTNHCEVITSLVRK